MEQQTLERIVTRLYECVLEEIQTNPVFAKKVMDILFEDTPFVVEKSRTKKKPIKTQRKKALFNPVVYLLEHEMQSKVLEGELEKLEITQLKDMIAEYDIDPNKEASRWRKKEKFITLILERSVKRSNYGKVFE